MRKVFRIFICIIATLSTECWAAEGENNVGNFAGLSLGVGVSLTVDLGQKDRVTSAEAVNGIVRINEEKNEIARVILESHYFFTPDASLFNVESGNWGFGPFVGVQPGSDKIVDAIAMGLMVGFRQPVYSFTNGIRNVSYSSASWNFGIGAIVDPKVKVLGDGVERDAPLPAGETSVRLKDESQWGVLLLSSFSF